MAGILRILLFMLLLQSFASASPLGRRHPKRSGWLQDVPDTHVLHERQEIWHAEGWTRIERADPEAILPVRIGLIQSSLDEGYNLLMAM
jgi:tripeptidyl-peptidase-1